MGEKPLKDIVDSSDPGDAVLQRFEYQAAYTAQLAVGMLLEDTPIAELFCEHHEDILVLLKNGLYQAVQIKTRRTGLEPFKSSDEPIVKAIKKFVRLEADYGSQVDRYVLVSNVGFWDAQSEHKSNLANLAYLSKNVPLVRRTNKNALLWDYLSEIGTPQERPVLLRVLQKLELETGTARFEDMTAVLVKVLSHIPSLKFHTYDELKGLAQALSDEVRHASHRELADGLSDFFVYLADPQGSRDAALIEGKRITDLRVSEVIANYFVPTLMVRSTNLTPLESLPLGINKTTTKLAAGRISVENIEMIADCKHSAEYELNTWIQKYGALRAKEKYEHLLCTTRFACQQAHDTTYSSDIAFGTQMLVEVRRLLIQLAETRSTDVFGFGPELLLGVAGVLTESCKLWWSDRFDITDGGTA